MVDLNIKSILSFLKKKKLKPELQKENDQIFIPIELNDEEFIPAHFSIDESGDLLQIIVIMPLTIYPEEKDDIAKWLHALNADLDLPGFCMDEETETIFYRIVIPCSNRKISNTLLDDLIDTIQIIVFTFIKSIFENAMCNEDLKDKKNKNSDKIIYI